MAIYQARPHPADTAGRHDDRYYTAPEVDALVVGGTPVAFDVLNGQVAAHTAATAAHGVTTVVGVDEAQALLNKTLVTPTISDLTNLNHTHAGVTSGGVVAHTSLTGVGTNTHTQIDTHITATAAHGVSGVVTGTQNVQTLTNKTLTTPTIVAGGLTNMNHTHAGAATGGTIDHTVLTAIGTNTHPTIDTHLANQLEHQSVFPFLFNANPLETNNSNNATPAVHLADTAINSGVLPAGTWTGVIVVTGVYRKTTAAGNAFVSLFVNGLIASEVTLAPVIVNTNFVFNTTVTGLAGGTTPTFGIYHRNGLGGGPTYLSSAVVTGFLRRSA